MLITDLIVFISPAIGALLAWFIVNHISDVKNQITEVKGEVKCVKNEVHEVQLTQVKIMTELEHIKESSKIKSNLTVIKEGRK